MFFSLVISVTGRCKEDVYFRIIGHAFPLIVHASCVFYKKIEDSLALVRFWNMVIFHEV